MAMEDFGFCLSRAAAFERARLLGCPFLPVIVLVIFLFLSLVPLVLFLVFFLFLSLVPLVLFLSLVPLVLFLVSVFIVPAFIVLVRLSRAPFSLT